MNLHAHIYTEDTRIMDAIELARKRHPHCERAFRHLIGRLTGLQHGETYTYWRQWRLEINSGGLHA